ncbi:glycosyltransferase family 2 protein [Hanstruepera neustonica]|uniref:Glycosyltransferase family 2 protein n=1 Tax=Hanstruepera neustonica TaxID=1445657 RepID=A0A2K1E0B5_9FLAO|nr:glycosyltransferase family A protein [Hanstruepera neustonica]PNQ73727.1 glycosyltransferase family 2 protein [Hanstruepera neustonica]
MSSKFSIIIPLYNKANHIAQTLRSVLNQTFTDFEIIIVNDGSTDNSLEIAKSFKDSRINIFTTENHGVSAARNFGIEKATANYIAFLDADDFWEETFLEAISSLIALHTNEHVFATALNIVMANQTYPAPYKNIDLTPNGIGILNYFTSSIGHSILHCANSVFSKNAIKDIGFFDESLKTNEDTDYWIRTGFKYPVVFINSHLANHLNIENGLSKTNKKSYKSIDFKKYIEVSNEQPESKPFLNKNIYSSIIKYKLLGETKNSERLKTLIDLSYLNKKQKLVISLPNPILKFVVRIYNALNKQKNYY